MTDKTVPLLWWTADAPHHWTADHLARMPEDGRRYETVAGALIVNSPANPAHQDAAFALHTVLHNAVHGTGHPLHVWASLGIRLRDGQLLVPDLVVARPDAPTHPAGLLDPARVLLAVEISTPQTVTLDSTTKPALYADAGIPHFWHLRLDDATLRTYTLRDGAYRPTHPTGE